MNDNKNNMFLVWSSFQRRAETLSNVLGMDLYYYHYSWEEKGKLFKLLSYIIKFSVSLADMFRMSPKIVFIQLAPTPLLYAAVIYCKIKGAYYASDCHNTMIYDASWINWPFAKKMLAGSISLIVHNDDVMAEANRIGLMPTVLRDPLPNIKSDHSIRRVGGITLDAEKYIIVPGSMAIDEPLEELFKAARLVPKVQLILTWYKEKLPADLHDKVPDNCRFTGFLPEVEFNTLYEQANGAIVLTTREGTQPSGASEAIALGVPLVISRIETTQSLYKDSVVYVDNVATSIAAGVMEVLENQELWQGKVSSLRADIVRSSSRQLDDILAVIAHCSEEK